MAIRHGGSWKPRSEVSPEMAHGMTSGLAPPSGLIALRIDSVLRVVAEVPAALLVVAEVVVLFTGVMARYVFRSPLIWTDELASILFLWLAMLGSVIALQRSEHMRLTAVVGGMSPAGRARTEALASAAVAVFLLMVVPSAWDYASDQWSIETPALGIPDTYRSIALLVGSVLMVITAVTRLLRLSWNDALFGVGVVAVLALALHFAGPWMRGFGNWNLLLFFVLLLGAGVLLSVPIGFAFGLATLAYLATLTRTPLTVVVSRMDEGMSSLILLAVPLFVFLGLLIEMTGMAQGDGEFPGVAAWDMCAAGCRMCCWVRCTWFPGFRGRRRRTWRRWRRCCSPT